MRRIATTIVVAGLVATALWAGLAFAPTAFALMEGGAAAGVNAARGAGVPELLMGDGGIVSQVINIMLFVVGFLSVIMLIWGGIRYVVSGGSASAVTAAKNTILYAIVGLVIALFAYAIINFVINSLVGGNFSGGASSV